MEGHVDGPDRCLKQAESDVPETPAGVRDEIDGSTDVAEQEEEPPRAGFLNDPDSTRLFMHGRSFTQPGCNSWVGSPFNLDP